MQCLAVAQKIDGRHTKVGYKLVTAGFTGLPAVRTGGLPDAATQEQHFALCTVIHLASIFAVQQSRGLSTQRGRHNIRCGPVSGRSATPALAKDDFNVCFSLNTI